MRLLLATHAQNLHARKFRKAKTVAIGVAVTLGISILGAIPAHAAPAKPAPAVPATSGDAKAAWDKSSHQAEIAAEQVNGAREAQTKAEQADKVAVASLAAAQKRAAATKTALAVATAGVSSYQAKLDEFASASFRGADLSQLSVMLTATSADDYLDESTVIDKVAQDTHKTLDNAVTAKSVAATAKSNADAAAAAATSAKTKADAAAVAATAAATTAQKKKTDLDAAVANYKNLYNQLSAQEKAAAAAAAEAAREQSLAAAAAAQAQANADAAAQQQAAPAPVQQAVAAAPAAAAPAATPAGTPATDSSSSAKTSTSSSAAPVAAAPSGDSAGEIAAKAAMSKIGNPYTYSGNGPEAFDCSGLTTWAWAQAGVGIPRTSSEQSNFPEVSLDQLQPGDLVTYYSPVSHVAIYVGNGMVVSAADEAEGIIYVPVGRGGPDPSGHRVPRG